MYKCWQAITQYWQEKVFFGLWTAFYSDDLPVLILLFALLQLLDLFTRWLALTVDWHKKVYPESPCDLLTAVRWMWQARKWRWIKSSGVKAGCNKMFTYLLLILLAATVDAALAVAHTPRLLLSVVVVVLATTEALSVMENLSDAGVEVVTVIMKKFRGKTT